MNYEKMQVTIDATREMTITQMVRTMANVCLPESELTDVERATMYIALILEANRRDELVDRGWQ